jgi:hypothetical protein
MNNNDGNQINTDKTARISPMKAGNIGQGVRLFHKECAPLQFIRELTQNSLESIRERGGSGNIQWTYDDRWYEENGSLKLCIIDDGIGMTGREVAEHINSIWSSGKEIGAGKNYGIGAKIAAAPLNPLGMEYWTWKNGKGYFSKLVYDEESDDFGLEWMLDDSGGKVEYLDDISDAFQPDIIRENGGNGVKVVLLGESEDDNTFHNFNAEMPSKWIQYYLNSRYYILPEQVALYTPFVGADEIGRSRALGLSKSLEKHTLDKGTIQVTDAKLHWRLLDEKEVRSKYTSYDSVAQSGALFNDEIYDHKRLGQHRSRMLNEFGLFFTHNRVVIFVEPMMEGLDTNQARSVLITENKESLPWKLWGWEFKQNLPPSIKKIEDDLNEKAQMMNDAELRKRIDKFRKDNPLPRFRTDDFGNLDSDDPLLKKHRSGTIGTGEKELPDNSSPSKPKVNYSNFRKKDHRRARREKARNELDWMWISESAGTRQPDQIPDKSAEWIPDQKMLLINSDARYWTSVVSQVMKKTSDGNPKRDKRILDMCRNEYSWLLIETVLAANSRLNDNEHWDQTQVEKQALSPQALTSVTLPTKYIVSYLVRNMSNWLGKKNLVELEQ